MARAEQNKAMVARGQWSWTEALDEASTQAFAYEQDYDNEITYFEWSDGSVSQFMGVGQEIMTYGSRK